MSALIRTELSGIGHYGVCTIVSRASLEKLLAFLADSPLGEDWENLELDPWKRLGFGGSLKILTTDQESPEIKLAWQPTRLANSLKSHGILMRVAELIESGDISPGDQACSKFLSVFPFKTSSGWAVQADFSNDVWDIIETPGFAEILPQINAEIRAWWEDQTGSACVGQYTTIFSGVNGPTIQVYHPRGNGLWIVGSRRSSCSHQLTDHNTDCSHDCFAHVFSLAVILKHCRNFK